MSKYLQRFSFIISYYDKESHDKLVQINSYLNSLKDKQEYIEYFKLNPNSLKVRNDYLTNRISGIAHFMGDLFKRAMGKYEIKNTAIINFNLSNYDSVVEQNCLGEYLNCCGFIYKFFDWSKFLNLDDSGKRFSLLDFIYKSLLDYTNKFQLESKSIIEAYESLKNTDLSYLEKDYLYLKRNKFKLYKILTYNFENTQYGILIEDINTGKRQRINVCEKEHYYGVEQPWLSIHEIMEIPQFLKYNGFDKVKNSYEMSFGKEIYSLDLETLQITNR